MDGAESELLMLLRMWCNTALPWEERSKATREVVGLVKSQRVRDAHVLPREAYRLLMLSVTLVWYLKDGQCGDNMQASFAGIISIPEFDDGTAEDFVDDGFLTQLCGRFQVGLPNERLFLRDTLHWVYSSFPRKRPFLRRQIGSLLCRFVRTPTRSVLVAEVLQVVRQIIKGFPESLGEVHRSLLTDILLPLHEPDQMAVWSAQQPIIESYHEALVSCLIPFLERQPDLLHAVFEAIVAAWPEGFHSNTPKEVLLLHEIGTLIKVVPLQACAPILKVVMPKILECLRVDNSRVVERALFLFKEETFTKLLGGQKQVFMEPLLSALLRGGEPFWNPTVTKMTAHVLETLEELDPEVFASACESLWGDAAPLTADVAVDDIEEGETSVPPAAEGTSPVDGRDQRRVLTTTLKGAMGSWRPPVRREAGEAGVSKTLRNPPAAVTGVAPWAVQTPQRPTSSQAAKLFEDTRTVVKDGVSPLQTLKRPLPRDSAKMGSDGSRRDGPEGLIVVRKGETISSKTQTTTHLDKEFDRGSSTLVEKKDPSSAGGLKVPAGSKGSTLEGATGSCNFQGPGTQRVKRFILKLKPKQADGPSGPSWQELQLEPTPTLLPSLRFHDLVFGHELGQGSFSSVKYARLITKGKTRSEWPEFAVKVISTTKIQELDYEKSVTNEIACLRILSHPGIARLVSAFRWRDGAYLVLEYASRGDLHTHIQQHGSLAEASARFVLGEVVAALCSVHSCGFVYGDLKPENILITESGHIKIADFGACRPVTAAAKDILDRSRNALRTLRDGDWRVAAGLPPNPLYTLPVQRGDSDSDSDVGEDDSGDKETLEEGEQRAEGTAAYLPPEVARGGTPNFGSDAWALGCVMFVCLAGRPPIFGETDEAIKARVVRFASQNADSKAGDVAMPALPREVSEASQSLIAALMKPDPKNRLGVERAAKHEFFVECDIDVFALHRQKPVELAQGSVAPTPNAAWSRRQNSMIWAPMPQEYRFNEDPRTLKIIPETKMECRERFQLPFGTIRES